MFGCWILLTSNVWMLDVCVYWFRQILVLDLGGIKYFDFGFVKYLDAGGRYLRRHKAGRSSANCGSGGQAQWQ